MPRRNSPNAISGLEDLNHLGELVYDKRSAQRAAAKKNRRNRHYEKLFLRHAVTHHEPVAVDPQGANGPDNEVSRFRPCADRS